MARAVHDDPRLVRSGLVEDPLTCDFALERVTGIEPALSAWESSGERPLSASPCYFRTSGPRTYPTRAPKSSLVRPVCETRVRGRPEVIKLSNSNTWSESPGSTCSSSFTRTTVVHQVSCRVERQEDPSTNRAHQGLGHAASSVAGPVVSPLTRGSGRTPGFINPASWWSV
jgi:hypothetical protein